MDVRVGRVGCGPTTGTATSITCTLTQGAAAGTYAEVKVLSAEGLVPVDTAAVTPITVVLATSSLSPNTDLNQSGGDTITILGTGLPTLISDVSVSFSDNS